MRTIIIILLLLTVSVKVSAQKKIIEAWSQELLCCDNNIALDAVELPNDNGYVVVGQIFKKEDSLEYASEIVHISRRGEVLNSKHIAVRYQDHYVRVTLTQSNRLLLVGYSDRLVLTILELDLQLEEIGRYQINGVTASNSEPPELIETSGGYVVLNSHQGKLKVIELNKQFETRSIYSAKDTMFKAYDFRMKSVWYLPEDDRVGLVGWCCSVLEEQPCYKAGYTFICYFDLRTNKVQQFQIFAPGMLMTGSSLKGDTVFLAGIVEWKEVDDWHSNAVLMAVTTSGKEIWRKIYEDKRKSWFHSALSVGDSIYVAGSSWNPGDKVSIFQVNQSSSVQFQNVMPLARKESLDYAEYFKLVSTTDGILAIGKKKGKWLISRFVFE